MCLYMHINIDVYVCVHRKNNTKAKMFALHV